MAVTTEDGMIRLAVRCERSNPPGIVLQKEKGVLIIDLPRRADRQPSLLRTMDRRSGSKRKAQSYRVQGHTEEPPSSVVGMPIRTPNALARWMTAGHHGSRCKTFEDSFRFKDGLADFKRS
ncbi:hypothetical protein CISG_06371 [Coccidioides immitis RMSCC 3703]|uniref:Uncharacterized protein n=2 Tax=Coccidioides immitis TaxID=5501 RepID=A0A0J8QZ40_COCIT|nr:hypothetical protein CIRG_01544 [Coccidioides immitis RMSCC 2394]KMU77330.1 hypothetical protein CISG_06371 [Coccidioides immitis RMSCC 3703]